MGRRGQKLGEQLGIDLTAVRVGILGGDYVDARCAWTKQREFGPEGAVLVRPDRYVGSGQRVASIIPNRRWRPDCIKFCI